ncbi:UNVERIFIED_CONTAM: hypothetical protein NCL1_06481 [Trichonephila clavipes]
MNPYFCPENGVPVKELSIECLGRVPRGLDKLDLTRYSGYKFRSTSVKAACRSFAPRVRNELKLALMQRIISL